jgi:hypothetical protein
VQTLQRSPYLHAREKTKRDALNQVQNASIIHNRAFYNANFPILTRTSITATNAQLHSASHWILKQFRPLQDSILLRCPKSCCWINPNWIRSLQKSPTFKKFKYGTGIHQEKPKRFQTSEQSEPQPTSTINTTCTFQHRKLQHMQHLYNNGTQMNWRMLKIKLLKKTLIHLDCRRQTNYSTQFLVSLFTQ